MVFLGEYGGVAAGLRLRRRLPPGFSGFRANRAPFVVRAMRSLRTFRPYNPSPRARVIFFRKTLKPRISCANILI